MFEVQRRSVVHRALISSAVLHILGLVGLAAWSTHATRRRPEFAGRQQPVRLVVQIEPEWQSSTSAVSTSVTQQKPPVVIEPAQARIAKRRYVLARSPEDAFPQLTDAVDVPFVDDPDAVPPVQPLPQWETGAADGLGRRRQVMRQLAELPSAQVPLPALGHTQITPPDLSQNSPPTYPELAIRRGWQGTVYLRLVVDEQGAIRDVQIIRSSGYPILDAAAANAVRNWTATAAQRDGVPVTTVETLPVQFKLN